MSMLSSTSKSVRLRTRTKSQTAREVFFDLFDGQADARELKHAARYLSHELENAARLDADLPDEVEGLYAWMQADVERVGESYRGYLEERKAGGARRYFKSKSHALGFLKSVAPTKLVDGAWLYGLLPHWNDPRFTALIQTYLEELGEGSPAKNHVVLYKKLLASQGCERWDDLSDEHYVQGALQLALAYHADQFLPEVIGFNLGYEQLPLHLLITAYELKEFGIDPYYFTLHITVDNADSGHARKAVDAVIDSMPRLGDTRKWYRRVQNGYKLNLLGASTNSVIESFDLEREMVAIFSRKGAVGRYAHSDYRMVAGKTINEWLSEPEQTSALLAAMEKEGWFKRHQEPENSRFWKLIQSEKAKMFGVFSPYEQQVIHDWIAGDALDRINSRPAQLQLSFQAKRNLAQSQSAAPTSDNQRPHDSTENAGSEFDSELRALEANLASSVNLEETMTKLIRLMSPANHHSAPGLMATRIFDQALS